MKTGIIAVVCFAVISPVFVLYGAGTDVARELKKACRPGDLIALHSSSLAVMNFCDMHKPIVQNGRETICTMNER